MAELRCAVLPLELDGVGGIVGIGDFGGEVGDDDLQSDAVFVDVEDGGEEETGETRGLGEGEKGGLCLVIDVGSVIIKGVLALREGEVAVELGDVLGDGIEVDVLQDVELVVDLQHEVGLAVGEVEGLGGKAVVGGEGEERAVAFCRGDHRTGVDADGVCGALRDGLGFLADAVDARRGAVGGTHKTVIERVDGAGGGSHVVHGLAAVLRQRLGHGGREEVGRAECLGRGVERDVRVDDGLDVDRCGRLLFAVGHDGDTGVTALFLYEVLLHDAADVVERGLVLEGVQDSGENRDTLARHADRDLVEVKSDGDGRGELVGEEDVGRRIGDCYHL